MSGNKPRFIRNTPEEEEEIARQIAENPDEAECTDEHFANAMTLDELSPEGAKWFRERKAAFDAGLLEYVTIVLDRETIDWFKHQTGEDGPIGGTKWMMLAEKTLKEHARRECGAGQENATITQAD